MQGIAGFQVQGQDAPGVAKQAFTFKGRTYLPLAAVEHGAAQALLQTAQLLADRGLGEVQALGGAGEVAGIDHGHEAAQQYWIKHRHSPFGMPLVGMVIFNFTMIGGVFILAFSSPWRQTWASCKAVARPSVGSW
ncbi:hypothetical protein D3C81_1392580 [compost metagenome]